VKSSRGPGVMDAVKDGTVEVGHTCSYYFIGKDPTFAFDTAVPFGLNSRQQTAWMLWQGGGLELREFFKDYNIHNIPCGNTGAQMGGWFRKEIKTVTDLKGLKFRSAALPARCWPSSAWCRSRFRAATSTRARKGHHRCRRMDRPLR
jgi:TRAP-type mannitol/chloroaromatic compound transport system substrate-binding protein